jgi:hypothetical protein
MARAMPFLWVAVVIVCLPAVRWICSRIVV